MACTRCLDLPPLLLAVSPCATGTSWTLNPDRGLVQLLPKHLMGSPLSSLAWFKIMLDPITGECCPRRRRHVINRVVLSWFITYAATVIRDSATVIVPMCYHCCFLYLQESDGIVQVMIVI